MSWFYRLLVMAVALGLGVASLQAQEQGYWRASSNTAKSITGDVSIGANKLVINFSPFVVAEIRDLKPAEMKALFDAETDAVGTGKLYRLGIPGSRAFLRKNTLCGSADVLWMATEVIGKELHVAFFSNPAPPVFTFEAIGASTDLCGTFTYSR